MPTKKQNEWRLQNCNYSTWHVPSFRWVMVLHVTVACHSYCALFSNLSSFWNFKGSKKSLLLSNSTLGYNLLFLINCCCIPV